MYVCVCVLCVCLLCVSVSVSVCVRVCVCGASDRKQKQQPRADSLTAPPSRHNQSRGTQRPKAAVAAEKDWAPQPPPSLTRGTGGAPASESSRGGPCGLFPSRPRTCWGTSGTMSRRRCFAFRRRVFLSSVACLPVYMFGLLFDCLLACVLGRRWLGWLVDRMFEDACHGGPNPPLQQHIQTVSQAVSPSTATAATITSQRQQQQRQQQQEEEWRRQGGQGSRSSPRLAKPAQRQPQPSPAMDRPFPLLLSPLGGGRGGRNVPSGSDHFSAFALSSPASSPTGIEMHSPASPTPTLASLEAAIAIDERGKEEEEAGEAAPAQAKDAAEHLKGQILPVEGTQKAPPVQQGGAQLK